MSARAVIEVDGNDFNQIKEVLEAYAVLCGQMAEKLGDNTIKTDGVVTVRRGLYSLRNVFSRELGRMSVLNPSFVQDWQPPKRKPLNEQVKQSESVRKAARGEIKAKRSDKSK